MECEGAENVEVEIVGTGFSPRPHRIMLVTCIAVIVAAFTLVVLPDQRVAPRFATEHPLPPSCLSRSLFGADCPGCGLTRSFVHLAALRVRDSLAVHPLGWLLAIFVVAQVPYRWVALVRREDAPFGRRVPRFLCNATIVLLIGLWIVRIGQQFAAN